MRFEAVAVLRALAFVRRAVARHRLAAGGVLLLFAAAAGVACAVLPRQYSGETRVLAKKNYTMPAIAAPRRTVPSGAEAPAQSATELVLQRGALLQVVRRAHLVERWTAAPPPLRRLKERVRALVAGPRSPEEMEDGVVGILRRRLRVAIEDNEVVRIHVTWWTADDVPAILREAVAAFLESRQWLDVQSIETTVAILQQSADTLQGIVAERLTVFREARARAVGRNVAAVTDRREPNELGGLRTRLVASRLTREDLQRQRELRIGELQMRIAEQSASLGERHPDQIAARAALARLGEDDGGVGQALAEEQELEQAYLMRGGSLVDAGGSGSRDGLLDAPANPDEDADVIYARAMLRMAVDDLEDMTGRLSNARIELATARAAFAYRYIETAPPERPERPDSPNVALIVVGGVLAGLGAAVGAATALELWARLGAPTLLSLKAA